MAREHHEEAALGCRTRDQPEHLEVRLAAKLRRLQHLRRLDRLVLQHRLVVEEQTDGVELMARQEVHVPIDRVVIEPARRPSSALAPEPVHSLEMELLLIRV